MGALIEGEPRTLDDVFVLAESIGLLVEIFEIDGTWYRVPLDGGKPSDLSGAYCLSEFLLGSGVRVIVGMLCNWKLGREERLTLEGIKGVSAEDMREARKRSREAVEAGKVAKALQHEETAARADKIWAGLPDEGRSPYLQSKGVKAYGLRFSRGSIVVPARDIDGKLWTLQFINKDGGKLFLSGGAKRGRFHLIGRLPDKGQALSAVGVAEGYATAEAGFTAAAKAFPMAVAFDAGNILPVSEAFRARYPEARIIIFADHDVHKGYPVALIKRRDITPALQVQIDRLARVRPDVAVEVAANDDPRFSDKDKHYNVGVTKALIAAAAVDGDVLVPRFDPLKEAAL